MDLRKTKMAEAATGIERESEIEWKEKWVNKGKEGKGGSIEESKQEYWRKKSKSREMMKNDSNDKISTATEMSFIFVLNSI